MREFKLVSGALVAALTMAALPQEALAQRSATEQLADDLRAATNQTAEEEVWILDRNQQAWVLVPRSVAQAKGGPSYPADGLPAGHPVGSTFMALIDAFAESDAGEKIPNDAVQTF
ncbi:hypothetical protein [Maricaulis sp.]|uniref:hypothetical protein n=1 Tax=Maricaulis sp. TaxID=1486257 RepID=UPI003A8EB5AA